MRELGLEVRHGLLEVRRQHRDSQDSGKPFKYYVIGTFLSRTCQSPPILLYTDIFPPPLLYAYLAAPVLYIHAVHRIYLIRSSLHFVFFTETLRMQDSSEDSTRPI